MFKADLTVEFSSGSKASAVLFSDVSVEQVIDDAVARVREIRLGLEGSELSLVRHRVAAGKA